VPLSQLERSGLLFNLRVEMVPSGAVPTERIGFTEAFRMVGDALLEGSAIANVGPLVSGADEGDESVAASVPSNTPRGNRYRPNIVSIERADWAEDGYITYLIHHSDLTATDPALKNMPTGEVWTAGKDASDGLAHAAHLMISTEAHLTSLGRARAVLERVPGVSRSIVVALLNKLLREQAAKQDLKFRDTGTRKLRKCHPKLIGEFVLSHQLQRDLANGKLNGVEFIRHNVLDGFESEDTIVPVVSTAKFKIPKSPSGPAIFELLGRLKSLGRQNNFEEMRIHFIQKETGQNLSPTLSTDLVQAEELMYARTIPMNDFEAPLIQCPEEIVMPIQRALRKVIDDSSQWA
jgi:hypothetical protein